MAWVALSLAGLVAGPVACRPDRARVGRATVASDTLVVFHAGSLTVPFRAALDSFRAAHPVIVQDEVAGSLETARKLTDLHRIPDLIGLADYEVFPDLLMPRFTTWYATFARNRMVIAYTDRSEYASEITPDNWPTVLTRAGVEVGRSDPNQDPNGYRTLLTLQLAESYYHRPGLLRRLTRDARNVRPKEVDLVGLLQAGELDYIWSYESVAVAAHLHEVRLPSAIDLGRIADSARYARASVRVQGATPGDTVTIRGQPIVYALSIPLAAPHPAVADRFVAWLLGPAGRRIMRGARLDVLDTAVFVGTGVPPALRGG